MICLFSLTKTHYDYVLQLNAFIKKLKQTAKSLLKVSKDNFNEATVTLFILTDFQKPPRGFCTESTI